MIPVLHLDVRSIFNAPDYARRVRRQVREYQTAHSSGVDSAIAHSLGSTTVWLVVGCISRDGLIIAPEIVAARGDYRFISQADIRIISRKRNRGYRENVIDIIEIFDRRKKAKFKFEMISMRF